MRTTAAKAHIYHELSKLSAAGFPLIKATEAALDTHPPDDQAQFLRELKAGIEGGATLADAAAATSAPISPLEISILDASEKGGHIPEGFAHLARYFEMQDRAARRIRTMLIYPVVLLHFAIILPGVPRAFFDNDFPGFFLRTGLILLGIYAAIAVGWPLFRRLSRAARHSPQADSLLRRLPLVGKVRRAFALSRFAEVLRINLISGQGPMKGMRAAAKASGSACLHASVESRILPEIKSGHPVGPALMSDHGKNFPPTFARAYASSEESGTLDTEMARWVATFADQAESAITRLSTTAPVVIYAGVALLVIWQIFSMFTTFYLAPMQELMDGLPK
jgi:type II secretory pathway component PulF